ncbi:MAG: C-GCAxxG-C-C family (seleno)protein, partial [Anaerolineae bacterium]
MDEVNEIYSRLQTEAVWSERVREVGALAYQYEQTYHGCGQCTFAALMDTLGETDAAAADAAFGAATGFAGGLGLYGDGPCGALVGASMAFGILYPRRREAFGGDRENKYRTYRMVQQLHDRY